MPGLLRIHHFSPTVFDEKGTGLDHVAFEVADIDELQQWADRLDSIGVAHSAIRSVTDPVPFSTVVFRDPDNIQLELIVMG
ncbi:VOC family protein [Acidiferrimicrobium sp. IK]|uniref:VOC family protein n=1 Tax=Acidiferrimicrobium sp. IK TaxID=2871700 RepID=UPI0021CB4E5C|nr:VOC family protein [Acidiferrimicrobium sp. IK]MCU4184454.1 VOC family protein [Acidiferrimicrobium sp. IK]